MKMNKSFLLGFQKGTVDCLCYGVEFQKKVVSKLTCDNDYAKGFVTGVKMFEDNKDLMSDIEEAKKL